MALLAVFGWQAGAVLALGLTCFVSRAGPVPPVLARWREHLRILMMASIAMGVLAGVSVLLAQSLRVTGTGAWQPWSSSTWTALLLHTRFGQGWSLSKLFWLPCCWWCYSPAAPAGLSLVLSGVIIASTQLIYWRALFGTRYGGVLGLKLALIAFALAAAFRLRTLVLPRLRALDARDALQRARPLIVVELLCAFAAFMVALQLARTTPGAHAAIHWWLPWRLAPAAAWALPATPWLCAISACWQQGVPKIPPGGWKFPSVRPDLGWLRQNRAESTLTWIGHATFLLQVGGVNILTDPPLTARASPSRLLGRKRWVPPALTLNQLPHIDLVVLSHNHYDHLDTETVRHLYRQPGGAPQFYVPLGLARWFASHGIPAVREHDWWQIGHHGELRLTFTPAQHWSARTVWDRNQTLWGGWRLDHPRLSFFFAGDTGYSQDFKDIRARLGPVDLAALPIGAYAPRWFMRASHVDPDEAVQIHLDLEARQSVAMHWGTFVLTDEPLDEPPHRLRAALRAQGLADEVFRVMRHGEIRRL